MQPGRGRGDGAVHPRERRLVIRSVLRRRSGRAGNVGRQRERPRLRQRRPEGLAVAVEAQRDAAVGIARQHGRGHGGPVQRQRVARMQAAGVAGERVPGAVRPWPVERQADPGLPAPRAQLGRDHPRVVGDQDIARPEQPGKIPHRAVGEGSPDHQQAGRVTRPRRGVGDAFRRQVEVERSECHRVRRAWERPGAPGGPAATRAATPRACR